MSTLHLSSILISLRALLIEFYYILHRNVMSARRKFNNNFQARKLGRINAACDRFLIRISENDAPVRKKQRCDCTSSHEMESIIDTSDSSEDYHDVLQKNLNRTHDGLATAAHTRIREDLASPASQMLPYTESSSTQELTENIDESGTHDTHHHTSCCKECRDNIIIIKQQLNALTMFMMESQEGHTLYHADNVLPEFPISDLEDLIKLNQLLTEDRTARLQFKQMIRKAGGQNIEKHVRNVLKFILVDSLADALSWTGQKNTICTKNMKFVELLIESITETWPDGTISRVQETIKSWLQHAGDRIRYEMKKFTI